MTKLFTLIVVCFATLTLSAQQMVDFEDAGIEVDTFLNGSDLKGGFTFDPLFFDNSFNSEWGSWSGWSISTKTDTVTEGYLNQYSSIVGSGQDGSNTFAVSYGLTNEIVVDSTKEEVIRGLYITNSTYAYLSMQNGDQFAKKFGGETGDDPDYFSLTIKSKSNPADSIIFYLADFRFENNAEDYIVNEWTYVDVSTLGDDIQGLEFYLTSTDVGQYGPSTPLYFCVDNIVYDRLLSNNNIISNVIISPNPVKDVLNIKIQETVENITVYNVSGQKVFTKDNATTVDLGALEQGVYLVRIFTAEGTATKKIIKL